MTPLHLMTHARFFDAPLALHPACAVRITSLLAGDGIMSVAPKTLAATGSARRSAGADRGYDIISGVAVVPVSGILVQRLGMLRPFMGMTGYDGIRCALDNAVRDRGISNIFIDIDSAGGEVAGCFDLADAIFEARSIKPITAILSENAFSAAYALASAAGKIYVPRTGCVGSIGIIAIFFEYSKAMKMAGVKMNVMQFGARKADGASELPMPKAARARFQADVNTMGALFVRTVARNRKISAGTITGFDGATFMGANAVRAGLSDQVAAPAEAFALVKAAGARRREQALNSMRRR